jgi:arylsulfatase A-like enzyme
MMQMFTNTSIRGPFGDNAEEMDYCIGAVLDHLVELGLDQDTLVFFTRSDTQFIDTST